MDKIRCVAYCRVSTNSKVQENSLENQKSYFNREIRKNNSYKYIDLYVDEGISGTKLKRPQFDRMLNDAGLDIIEVMNNDKDSRKGKIKYVTVPSTTRLPKFNMILVKNTSRFARNVLVEQILRDLAQNNVYVHFLDLDKCTSNIGDLTYIQIFQTFDERESRDKSNKVTFGIIEGAKKGNIRTTNTIYGYNYIASDNRLEIIENEAIVIEKIYELYNNGLGIRRIINWLEENKIYTRNRKSFCKTSLIRILTNEKYIGVSARLKYDTGKVFNKNTYAKIRPRNEWIINKTDKIPTIVSDELFYKCSNIMKSKVNHEFKVGKYNGITEFAGLIYCGICGNSYTSNVDRGRRFYNCSKKKQRGIKACNNENVSIKQIENEISNESYIGELTAWKIIYSRNLIKLRVRLTEMINTNDDIMLKELKDRLKELLGKKDRYVEMYANKIIVKGILDIKIEPILLEEKNLELLIIQKSKSNDDILKDINEINKTLKEMDGREIKLQYTHNEILNDIQKIVITRNKEIQVIYKTIIDYKVITNKHNDLRFLE